MPSLIAMLTDTLNKQVELYDNLLELSKEKKDVIVKNDVETLKKITSLENIIVGKNGKLEKSRLSMMQDIAMVLNRPAETLDMGNLLVMLEGQPESEGLAKTSERIRDVVTRLKHLNDQNRLLIQNSLDYIDFSVNIIHSALDGGANIVDGKGEEVVGDISFFDAQQ